MIANTALRGAREDLVWREQSHARGHSTSLDDIPSVLIYAVHLLWTALGRRSR